METVIVNDNIRITSIEMTKLKTNSIAVCIHRPLNRKEASYNALLPLVLKRGSMLCNDREKIAEYLDDLYGATMGATAIKRGEDQIIYFDAETIADKFAPDGEKLLKKLLQLVMSVVFDPYTVNGAFDDAVFEQERKNALDKLEAFVNDKRQYAATRCQQEVARGTDFEILRFGDKEGLMSVTSSSLYEYYKSIITSSVIDIYICGSCDLNDAVEAVKEYTADLEVTEAYIPKTEIVLRDESAVRTVEEKMDVAQGKLAIGFRTNVKPTDDDFYALQVFNSVFGAGAHSKLFNNVREKLSLAYYASSMLEKSKGILVVNAGVEFENFQKAYDETLVQLEEIRKGNITEHEFESSINAILNMCNSYFDDQRSLVIYYLSDRVAGTSTTLEQYIEKIKAVTVDEVVAVSKKITLDTAYFLTGKGEA